MRESILRAAALVAALSIFASGCKGEKRAKGQPHSEVPLNVNLLENPSFEIWEGAVPKGWKIVHFEGEGEIENRYGRSSDEKYSGNSAFYLQGTFEVTRWMALTQVVPVTPGYRLWFAAEMRSKNLKKNRGQVDRANLYVRFYDKKGKRIKERYWADGWTKPLVGTQDWRREGKQVDVPEGASTVEIGCVAQLTGIIYFDDVELILEAPVPWRKIETTYVDFYYLEGNPFPQGAIEREARYVEEVVRKLDIKPEKNNKVSYYLYPSSESFKEIQGVKIGHDLTRVRASTHELHTIKTYEDHQIVHLLLEPLGYPPFGLAEGIVFYAIGSWEGGRDIHMIVKDLLLNKRLPALYRILDQKSMGQVGMSISVPGWASFCIWLIDRYGIDKFKKLYVETNEIEEPGPFNAHFKSIYGRDFDVVDREWRLWVLRYKPKI